MYVLWLFCFVFLFQFFTKNGTVINHCFILEYYFFSNKFCVWILSVHVWFEFLYMVLYMNVVYICLIFIIFIIFIIFFFLIFFFMCMLYFVLWFNILSKIYNFCTLFFSHLMETNCILIEIQIIIQYIHKPSFKLNGKMKKRDHCICHRSFLWNKIKNKEKKLYNSAFCAINAMILCRVCLCWCFLDILFPSFVLWFMIK